MGRPTFPIFAILLIIPPLATTPFPQQNPPSFSSDAPRTTPHSFVRSPNVVSSTHEYAKEAISKLEVLFQIAASRDWNKSIPVLGKASRRKHVRESFQTKRETFYVEALRAETEHIAASVDSCIILRKHATQLIERLGIAIRTGKD